MSVTQTNSPRLPNGWRLARIVDLCVQDRNIIEPNSALAKRLPYVGLEHIESETGKILKDPREISADEGISTTFAFDHTHVLYGKLRPYLNKVATPNFAGRCTTELIPLRVRPNVSRRYLAWLLRRPQTVRAAMQEKTGSRMPRANMQHVLSLYVPIPVNLEDQRRVVTEFERRASAAQNAITACQEQLHLLKSYVSRTLESFPMDGYAPQK